MPTLDTGARDQLLHQFLAGIPRDIKPICVISDVKTLDQATERAQLLIAVDVDGPSIVI